MNKADLRKVFLPIIILFILINAYCIVFAGWLDDKKIDHTVLVAGNLILFVLTIIICFIHIKSARSSNPHAFVRGVTAASFIKLFVIAVSVIIYLIAAGESRSVYAVIASMIFYIFYTLFEVKGAMQINRKKNAEN